MDGFQGKIGQSLQFRLSAWLSLVILGFALAAGVFSFASAFKEAIEFQDDQLRQVAALVNSRDLPALPTPSPAPARQEAPGADPDSRVIVQTLAQPGTAVSAPAEGALALPEELADGMQTITLGHEVWRLFVRTLDSGVRIAVGQQTETRNDIARDSAKRTLIPFLFLIPILLLLVGRLIGGMLRPLRQLASELDRRAEQDLQAVCAQHLPSEIQPFVAAINSLLARVAQSVAAQHRFVADAAHELRSPLTALSLQAERLEAADLPPQARQRLDALRRGLQRARLLLEQMLALARAQEAAGDSGAQGTQVSMRRVFREVLEDLMPLAEAKRIDLGVTGQDDAGVAAAEVDLKTLVRNLAENAIRYTPPGGRVDLSVHTERDRVILRIDDTGPGIPESERERVFDPFYRITGNDAEGSGLGLSIVRTIAARIGAEVTLGRPDVQQERAGLRVTVEFPVAGSAPAAA
jgi:two-component system OmpR family sensor kinase